ncbi:MAG: putative channel TrkA-N [Micavibrio sp.]|nr:putative channel TrkA-N [Micavibrio sp.]
MNLFIELTAGSLMIGLTVIIQAIGLDLIMKRGEILEKFLRRRTLKFWQPAFSAIIVTYIFILHIINIWLWAFLYMAFDCLPVRGLSMALNFSTATYTTVGFNNVVLKPSDSLFTGIEAANGLILMGWATAFIFELVSQIYRKEARALKD